MLFAAEINYEGTDVNPSVQRFADVAGEDEFPEGIKLIQRYHSPGTKWGCVVVEADSVVALQLWLSEWIDVLDIKLHPVTTDETVAPVVEAMLSRQN